MPHKCVWGTQCNYNKLRDIIKVWPKPMYTCKNLLEGIVCVRNYGSYVLSEGYATLSSWWVRHLDMSHWFGWLSNSQFYRALASWHFADLVLWQSKVYLDVGLFWYWMSHSHFNRTFTTWNSTHLHITSNRGYFDVSPFWRGITYSQFNWALPAWCCGYLWWIKSNTHFDMCFLSKSWWFISKYNLAFTT